MSEQNTEERKAILRERSRQYYVRRCLEDPEWKKKKREDSKIAYRKARAKLGYEVANRRDQFRKKNWLTRRDADCNFVTEVVKKIKNNEQLPKEFLLDRYGDTPLHVAVKMRMEEQALAIINSDVVDIDARNCELNTPLNFAIKNKLDKVTRILIARKCDITAKNKDNLTPLDIAVIHGNEFAKELLTN